MALWDGLEEAVAVADAGSFVRAAARLGASTSHVSRAVARLEARLGAELFHRTTRRVDLTDTGRAFVEQGRRLIQGRDELLALVGGEGEPQGDLRITCSVSLGERFIAPIVRQFAAAHPRLNVSLDLTNRLIDLVAEGYDLGIRTGEVADHRLVGRRIASRTSETCAAPAYLARAGTPRTIDELASHDCLVGTNLAWSFRDGQAQRRWTPTPRWRCNSGRAVADAAIAGMGVCQLPTFYVGPAIEAGDLVPVLAEHRPAAEPIWLTSTERGHLLPKVRLLSDMLIAALPDLLEEAASYR